MPQTTRGSLIILFLQNRKNALFQQSHSFHSKEVQRMYYAFVSDIHPFSFTVPSHFISAFKHARITFLLHVYIYEIIFVRYIRLYISSSALICMYMHKIYIYNFNFAFTFYTTFLKFTIFGKIILFMFLLMSRKKLTLHISYISHVFFTRISRENSTYLCL